MYQNIGHKGAHGHMSSQWQTSIRSHCCVLNHWLHRGAWAHTVTLAQYCKPLSEVIGMYQKIRHMGTNGHILTHELTIDNHLQRV